MELLTFSFAVILLFLFGLLVCKLSKTAASLKAAGFKRGDRSYWVQYWAEFCGG